MVRKMRGCFVVLLCSGCTTTPQADFCDTFFRARNVCARPAAPIAIVPGTIAQPGCAYILQEKQGDRRGLFGWLRHRSNYQTAHGVVAR